MKIILVTLLLLSSLLANAQTQEQRQFGIIEVFRGGDSLFIKKLRTVVINVSEGTITKMRTPPDSAKLFIAPDGEVYEGVITWRKVGGVVTPVTEQIDGELATFVGSWVRTGTNPGWHNNTIAFSNTPGATASYTFTGTRVELWSELLPSHGLGTVTLNGVTTQVSFRGPSKLPALIYSSPTLPSGTYTIKLTVVTGYNLLDFIQVFK